MTDGSAAPPAAARGSAILLLLLQLEGGGGGQGWWAEPVAFGKTQTRSQIPLRALTQQTRGNGWPMRGRDDLIGRGASCPRPGVGGGGGGGVQVGEEEEDDEGAGGTEFRTVWPSCSHCCRWWEVKGQVRQRCASSSHMDSEEVGGLCREFWVKVCYFKA